MTMTPPPTLGAEASVLPPPITAPPIVDLTDRRVRTAPSGLTWALKRVFDVAAAAVLLVLSSPLLLLGAVGIKLTSPGPVLFRQPRVGMGGRTFSMLKLRTFPVEHQDVVFSIPHADCPLRFQRLLRRTSIDELPQLVNVLRGDMSIVGPRPERPHFAATFDTLVPGYSDRTRVRGGLTGLAQVSGMVGNTSLKARADLDNRYIDEWTMRGDMKILLRTIPAVFRKIGA